MKWNKLPIVFLFLLGAVGEVAAQDALPSKSQMDKNYGPIFSSKEMEQLMSFVDVEDPMPSTFLDTCENCIEDPQLSLLPFWQKLNTMTRPVRVAHLGDSHVRGHVFPYVMRKLLEADFGHEAVIDYQVTYQSSGLAQETGKPGIVYHILGVNGATCATYNTPERIRTVVNLNPDLIVLSFGTNEAHGRNYRSAEHTAQMSKLLSELKMKCPNATFLVTTPPGAYIRSGKTRIINRRTPRIVETEVKFARQNGLAIWNLYDIIGGETHGCKNWSAAKMFQRDKIHFTHAGYKLQGLLFHEAFIKAYNDYVASQLN